jgi:hypothetical protein
MITRNQDALTVAMTNPVTNTPLLSYLKDHLAGSISALELIDHLRGSAGTINARQFLSTLRDEIAADQRVLQTLLHDFGGAESRVREAAARLTEKLGELKLRIADPHRNGLAQVEALETLALGIQGKLALWTALEAIGDRVEEVGKIDLPGLKQRARDQHARVEARRLEAAWEAFTMPRGDGSYDD